MDENFIFLAMVVLYGISMGTVFFLYLLNRNIYTQKIIFLNRILDRQQKIEDYKMSSFQEFKIDKSGDLEYPPPIIPRFKKNPTYIKIVEDFEQCVVVRDRNFKNFTVIFLIAMGLAGLIVITVKFFHNVY